MGGHPSTMENEAGERQRRLIVDQFTRQAVPFAEFPAHSTEESIALVREAAGIGGGDRVLDLACGPGLTALDFARHAKHVTGIDLTPAMIEQARTLQQAKGIGNLDWRVGDVTALPFGDAEFTVAFTRYSFHHMLEPVRVLAEMSRVTAPGGRVVVVDVFSRDPEQARAYDEVEILRDPSHVHALGLDEFNRLFDEAGLTDRATSFYKLDVALESILATSFPDPGSPEKIRKLFQEDLGRDRLGVDARLVQGEIHFSFPIVVIVARKPAV